MTAGRDAIKRVIFLNNKGLHPYKSIERNLYCHYSISNKQRVTACLLIRKKEDSETLFYALISSALIDSKAAAFASWSVELDHGFQTRDVLVTYYVFQKFWVLGY